MKSTNKTPPSNSISALASIESVALDTVTGGCAACGQSAGAAGQAAGAVGQAGGAAGVPQLASLIGAFTK